MRAFCRLTALIVLLLALAAGGRSAGGDEQRAAISDFYGAYEGAAVDDPEGARRRDLGVVIKPTDIGFNVTWTTVTQDGGESPGHKTYSIDFTRAGPKGLYASAMRKDMFGNAVPLDPFKGDPFVWAALRGKTLTVYSLLITDDAGYELQTYDRTLIEEGLRLEFSRMREGLHLKYITATLVRTRTGP